MGVFLLQSAASLYNKTMQIFYCLLTGFAAGILSGLFGIGGGLILVPALIFFFHMPQTSATGTSLVALLLPVGILAVREYYRSGRIGPEHLKIGMLIAVGLFIGAYFGSRIAIRLPQHLLRRGFAVFLVGVAVRMWFMKR